MAANLFRNNNETYIHVFWILGEQICKPSEVQENAVFYEFYVFKDWINNFVIASE